MSRSEDSRRRRGAPFALTAANGQGLDGARRRLTEPPSESLCAAIDTARGEDDDSRRCIARNPPKAGMRAPPPSYRPRASFPPGAGRTVVLKRRRWPMATVVEKTGIRRAKGWLYYLDKRGDVSRARMARGGGKGPRGREKVVRCGIEREEGYLYFIDKKGHVAKVKMKRSSGGKKTVRRKAARKKPARRRTAKKTARKKTARRKTARKTPARRKAARTTARQKTARKKTARRKTTRKKAARRRTARR